MLNLGNQVRVIWSTKTSGCSIFNNIDVVYVQVASHL